MIGRTSGAVVGQAAAVATGRSKKKLGSDSGPSF